MYGRISKKIDKETYKIYWLYLCFSFFFIFSYLPLTCFCHTNSCYKMGIQTWFKHTTCTCKRCSLVRQTIKNKCIVSEWLLFNANSAIFQLYHGENKLQFNEMMMRSTLYKTNTLSWIFIVLLLAHWNNSPQIYMSPHSDTVSRFRANQYLLFLLNGLCLEEKQQMPILVIGLTDRGSNLRSTTLEHASHYTTDAVHYTVTTCFNKIIINTFQHEFIS